MDVDAKLAELKTSLYRIVSISIVVLAILFGVAQAAVVKYVSSNEQNIQAVQVDVKGLDKRTYIQASELKTLHLDIDYIKNGMDRIEKKLEK